MKLTIISHTEHYKTPNGTIVGWGPTVNEINHLLEIFDKINHLAMYHEKEAPLSALPYCSDRIKFVPIPSVGGITIGSKFRILTQIPKTIKIVSTYLKKSDVFQLRTPTGIGVYLIPYLTLFTKKQGWFKYAGNWNQKHPPLGYRLQRWMLKHQGRTVTINGRWPNQPQHCLSFENPCLTEDNLKEGLLKGEQKIIADKLHFCYVGRIESEKGVGGIIDAISRLETFEKERIEAVHFVGEGPEQNDFKLLCEASDVLFKFYGALSRKAVFDVYKQCQVFIMPTTASEGFPKVIAEAMNFGCIPIVSSVSAISQYVQSGHNGVLLKDTSQKSILNAIRDVFKLSQTEYLHIINNQRLIVDNFTFNHYNSKIKRLLD